MKALAKVTLAAVIASVVGCASSEQTTHTAAPDGFYIEAAGTAGSYALQVVPPSVGSALSFRIRPYEGFAPLRVVVFDVPRGHYVQISGRATDKEWSKKSIMIVAAHKPYFELIKSGQAVSETGERVGPSATVSLVLNSREEADGIAAGLRRRYSIP